MNIMEMSNKHYDTSKWVILVFLPALAVLIAGIGELYGLVNTPAVVTTINLITVFLGSVLQISSKQYHDNNDSSGGGLIVTNRA